MGLRLVWSAVLLGIVLAAAGSPGAQQGSVYVRETHGDWQVRCVRVERGGEPCQLYQLLRDGDGNDVAEITVLPLPPGQPAMAVATVVTPLETLLTERVLLRIDDAVGRRYPFHFCTAEGCHARIGLTAEEVDRLRAGRTATVVIRPAVAPEMPVELTVSLIGFTAAFAALPR